MQTSTQTRISQFATKHASGNVLARETRDHVGLLKYIFPEESCSQPILSVNQRIREALNSGEMVKYHREVMERNRLIRITGGNCTLTELGASVLRPGLERIVGDKGCVDLDVRLIFKLLDSEINGYTTGVPVKDLKIMLHTTAQQLYNSKRRLGSVKPPLIRAGNTIGEERFLLSKGSEKVYALDDAGKEFAENLINNSLANRIIRDYRQPVWISISDIMNKKERYPKLTQRFIEKSYKALTQSFIAKPLTLPKLTFFVFPWLEPIILEYAMNNFMHETTSILKEKLGFEIIPKYIFTGNDALQSFSSHSGCKATLFALESIHLPGAKILRDDSVLVGGIDGSPAYSVMGKGTDYKTAVYEEKTVYSKTLVKRFAKLSRIRQSREVPLESEVEYQKVINEEIEEKFIFHAKTPFGSLMKVQYKGIKELCREPITVGLLVSCKTPSELYAATLFREFAYTALSTLQDPRKHYIAVEEYVRRLPKLDPAFSSLPVVKKLSQSQKRKSAPQMEGSAPNANSK